MQRKKGKEREEDAEGKEREEDAEEKEEEEGKRSTMFLHLRGTSHIQQVELYGHGEGRSMDVVVVGSRMKNCAEET